MHSPDPDGQVVLADDLSALQVLHAVLADTAAAFPDAFALDAIFPDAFLTP